VLEFLRGRDDVALFGAYAVNAYVDSPRMTQDVDVLSTAAETLAEDLRKHLNAKFQIAVRVRVLQGKQDFRIFQVSKPKNRHLVDIRHVETLPPRQEIDGVPVLSPVELIVSKVKAFSARRGQPKAGTDWRDVAALLLAFPDLKASHGSVRDRLIRQETDPAVLETWESFVALDIRPEQKETDE
jgi:hypothetical protein